MMSIMPVLFREQRGSTDRISLGSDNIPAFRLGRVGRSVPNRSVEPGGRMPSSLRVSLYPLLSGFKILTRSYTYVSPFFWSFWHLWTSGLPDDFLPMSVIPLFLGTIIAYSTQKRKEMHAKNGSKIQSFSVFFERIEHGARYMGTIIRLLGYIIY